jgi:hypothetical protein
MINPGPHRILRYAEGIMSEWPVKYRFIGAYGLAIDHDES